MAENKRPIGTYVVLAWMIFNAIFYALELTIFNDAVDKNNSIMLVLWVLSITGLISMRKIGAAIATSTLIYALAFNTFNVIYYSLYLLNGTSLIVNITAAIYMFKIIFANKFRYATPTNKRLCPKNYSSLSKRVDDISKNSKV